jgi:hypothetical protein
VFLPETDRCVIGDLAAKFDSETRHGFNFAIQGSSGGYCAQGTSRQLHFGIDDGSPGDWQDCGRPSPSSNYVSNSITVFDGHLYAGTTDGATEADWSHVYRYDGSRNWTDCGRVGNLRTWGIGPMIVHNGHLYAGNWSYDWRRVGVADLDFCRVYRYGGGTEWVDCGQPGHCRRLFGIASFRGRLYVLGDDAQCHVHEGGTVWRVCGRFSKYAHPLAVHDGRLWAGVFGGNESGTFRPAEVHSYDGDGWVAMGSPMLPGAREDQIHELEVYRGRLHATTWPSGRVSALAGEGRWKDLGRLGSSTEINGLAVYNGKLYGGTIPMAEVYRFDGGTNWTLIRTFAPREDLEAPTPDRLRPGRVTGWGRVTGLAVGTGRMYAAIGSYTSALADAPPGLRGSVFAFKAGECASYDRDLGRGWRHVVAQRLGSRLEIWIDGRREAVSTPAGAAKPDISNRAPLRIGFGELGYFSGRMNDVRLYRRALQGGEIRRLAVAREGSR